MTILRTPDDVLRSIGPLSSDFYDVVRHTDAAAFSVKRRYPDLPQKTRPFGG